MALRGITLMPRYQRGLPQWRSLRQVLLIMTLGSAILSSAPVLAAQKLILRVGFLEQSVSISDLEDFVLTGKISRELKPYSSLLTPQVRQMLGGKLQLDPKRTNQLVADLLHSPTGDRLVKTLGVVIPNSTIEQIQAGISLAMRQANGLNAINFFKAYPAENITIDISSAIAVGSRLNLPYWQTQALSPLLQRELVESSPPFHPTFDPAAPGPMVVQQQTLILSDQKRHRSLPVDIYWGSDRQALKAEPSRENTQPLIVISHGFAADRKFLSYLAVHLASYGFTVAAIEHPGSNGSWLSSAGISGKPTDFVPTNEFIDRPKDISWLLDELAKLNQQPGELQGKLHTEQVSVIGHSLGGYTALALAGAELDLKELRQFCQKPLPIGQAVGDWIQCAAAQLPEEKVNLRDERIVSAIALNPLIGNLFGAHGMAQINIPILILSGTEDVVTPALNHQLRPFAQLKANKYLLTAIGSTHLSVGTPLKPDHQITDNNQIAVVENMVLNERRGQETEPLRQLLRGVSLAFIKQLTPEAKIYQPFLTSAYAQSLSTPEIPLRLNSELPQGLNNWLQITAGFPLLSLVQTNQLTLLLRKNQPRL